MEFYSKINMRLFSQETHYKLDRTFCEWNEIIRSYCKYKRFSDTPYVHREKTVLGTFLSAIVRIEGFALEELTIHNPTDKTDLSMIDFWFAYSDGEEFVCKCKQQWNSPTTPIEKLITKRTITATHKARKYSLTSSGLAMTFWTPTFNSIDEIDYDLHIMLNNITYAYERGFVDMFCAVSPKELRNFEGSNGKYYPCVVLLGKVVDYL